MAEYKCITVGTVTLIQVAINNFTVVYGNSRVTGLDYELARREFANCVFNELQFDGRLDHPYPHERAQRANKNEAIFRCPE